MKNCPKCGSSENGFFNNKANRDGLSSQCKKCHTKSVLRRRKENCEAVYARRKEWYAANKERLRQKRRDWWATHPQTEDQKQRAIERVAKWAKENPERRKKIAREWVNNNPGKVNANTRRRQTIKLNATPTWVDHEAIKQIYIRAAELTQQTGIRHEVDHIIPLRCKDRNGLHVPWNLQILPYHKHREKCSAEMKGN